MVSCRQLGPPPLFDLVVNPNTPRGEGYVDVGAFDIAPTSTADLNKWVSSTQGDPAYAGVTYPMGNGFPILPGAIGMDVALGAAPPATLNLQGAVGSEFPLSAPTRKPRQIKAAQMPAVTVTPPIPPNLVTASAATAAPTASLANSADNR
jgi:hypothetical protein